MAPPNTPAAPAPVKTHAQEIVELRNKLSTLDQAMKAISDLHGRVAALEKKVG